MKPAAPAGNPNSPLPTLHPPPEPSDGAHAPALHIDLGAATADDRVLEVGDAAAGVKKVRRVLKQVEADVVAAQNALQQVVTDGQGAEHLGAVAGNAVAVQEREEAFAKAHTTTHGRGSGGREPHPRAQQHPRITAATTSFNEGKQQEQTTAGKQLRGGAVRGSSSPAAHTPLTRGRACAGRSPCWPGTRGGAPHTPA